MSAAAGGGSATAAIVSRWARRYVLAACCFLVLWQAGALAGVSRRVEVVLGLHGFVLHVFFGKAYSLVPTYFDRTLAVPRAPAIQLPLVAGGTAALALAALDPAPAVVSASSLAILGAALWLLGVLTFVAALGWTIRTNPTGSETGTGEHNAHRRRVDRIANAFVPLALLYLLVGSYETLAVATAWSGAAGAGALLPELPRLLAGGWVPASHLLGAGTAALAIFALGFRLLPRFLVASVPRPLVATVLPAGAVGPALLAAGFPAGTGFGLGAAAQALAVAGFAVGIAVLFRRSDRRRVGTYGVLCGAAAGVGAVALGVGFALGDRSAVRALAHLRLNLLGFLGLTILGVAYHFYPPAVGQWPGASDRTALASIAALAAGLLAQALALIGRPSAVATVEPALEPGEAILLGGELATLVGALLAAYVLGAAFATR